VRVIAAVAAAMAAITAVLAAALPGPGAPGKPRAEQMVQPPLPVAPAERGKLPLATTYTSVLAAPVDSAPWADTGGLVIHPRLPQILYAGPGKQPVAVLPPTQLGGPTWVPVVQVGAGWYRVLLPSRPNGATGWIYSASAAASQLDVRHSAYLVRISVGERTLSLYKDGGQLGLWTVAVGAAPTPTPTGRTFLLASLSPPHPTYSPLILPLGFHSNTLTTYGGGPGTVGIHGWPSPSVFGQAVSHGCVRIPTDGLQAMSQVPLGTLVLITS
jgi:lipoprotein-anchoring transpeptidase ErfK/SrfK